MTGIKGRSEFPFACRIPCRFGFGRDSPEWRSHRIIAAIACHYGTSTLNDYKNNGPDNAFLTPILPDLEAVNRIIRQQMHSDVALIGRIADYIINAGGKRIRPVLVLLMAKALGYQGTLHQILAATIEFIHTATLLHDDVVDESELRRGIPSANALFGNASSVLVGDFLYTRAFQMMVSAGNMRILDVLADATNLIAEGEVLQLMNIRNTDIDEEGYFKVIYAKTAKLFEASSVIGALVAGAAESEIDAAARFGRALGMAFQLVDDMLDYAGDKGVMGKNAGNDLKEGKMTLPLIYLMKNGSTEQKMSVRKSIEDNDGSCFEGVLHAVRSAGALAYTHSKAQQAARDAAQALSVLNSGQYKKSLLELSSFSVERNY